MKMQQNGFSYLYMLLSLVVLSAVIGAGYMVYKNSKTDKPAGTNAITNFDECVAAGNPVMESYPEQCAANGQTFANPTQISSGTCKDDWTAITDSTVVLGRWSVSLDLPKDLVGKALCKYDTNNQNYVFSRTEVINNAKCIEQYQHNEIGTPGLIVARYDGSQPVEGYLSGEATTSDGSRTIKEYFDNNREPNTNYVLDTEDTGRRYYKIGEYYYHAFSDTPQSLQAHRDDRIKNCPAVPPNYTQVFADAMATLR